MPKRNNKGSRDSAGIHITWRYILVSTLIVLFAARIAYVVFSTTVVNADKWIEKANKELQRRDVLPPMRGDILSADGSVLATNLHYYTLHIDFRASKFSDEKFLQALDSLCDTLAYYHPVRTRDEWHSYLSSQMKKKRGDRSRYFTLLRNLSHAESEAVKDYPFFRNSRNPNRTGLISDAVMRRSYPYGAMARRSIGRVGQTEESSEVHGISGLEYALDWMLYGKPGTAKKVALTRNIVNWTDVPPVNGMTLTTTIDVSIQDIVEHALVEKLTECNAEWGTVIVMEVETGDIKAISNLERDNAGNYIESMNHAIQGFEPGSVMKTISMVIALEDGFVKNPETEFYTTGAPYVFGGGKPIKDTHSPASLPVSRFLEYSSNIGMTKLVAPHFKNDPNAFRERIRQLGLLDTLYTGIAGEHPPYFPPLDLKSGGLVSLGRQTYGYATQIPPIYMCAFYNAVANNGRFVRPRLVSKITTERGDSLIPVSYVRERICSPQTAATIRQMLHQVIYGEGGTAKRLRDDLVDIAGKTGTSKVAREISRKDLEKSRINPSDQSIVVPKGYEENSYRFSFCGFFPYENPKYTCMVMISRPHGTNSAAETSGRVLLNIARRMYSHGMLGNSPDFHKDANMTASTPVFYATHSEDRDRNLKAMTGSPSAQRLKTPTPEPGGTVPNVKGLGLREAIVQLEKAGYNIVFEGDGSVLSQTPPAGTAATRGTKVSLTLTKH